MSPFLFRKALIQQNALSAGPAANLAVAAGVSVVDLLVIQANMNAVAGLVWAVGVGMWIRGKGRRLEREVEKLEAEGLGE